MKYRISVDFRKQYTISAKDIKAAKQKAKEMLYDELQNEGWFDLSCYHAMQLPEIDELHKRYKGRIVAK